MSSEKNAVLLQCLLFVIILALSISFMTMASGRQGHVYRLAVHKGDWAEYQMERNEMITIPEFGPPFRYVVDDIRVTTIRSQTNVSEITYEIPYLNFSQYWCRDCWFGTSFQTDVSVNETNLFTVFYPTESAFWRDLALNLPPHYKLEMGVLAAKLVYELDFHGSIRTTRVEVDLLSGVALRYEFFETSNGTRFAWFAISLARASIPISSGSMFAEYWYLIPATCIVLLGLVACVALYDSSRRGNPRVQSTAR